MIPARGNALVRPVDTEEATASGIVLTQNYRDFVAAFQCEVIAVGAPAYCDATKRENRACRRAHEGEGRDRVHPVAIAAGDWLVVRPRCFIDSPRPERKEWFMRQDDAYAILRITE